MTGLRPTDLVVSRPDNTTGLTGGDGNLLEQDGAKAVFRGGVSAENGDFDVYQHDLVEDGDLVIPLDSIGGASLINAQLVSLGDPEDDDFSDDPTEVPTDAAREFTVRVEDLADGADVEDPDAEEILISRVPEPTDDVTQGRLAAGVFSDNGRIVVEHNGLDVGSNLINGSFNVQSGSTDAVQIRGVDGTVQDADNSDELEAVADALGAGFERLAESRTTFEEETSLNRSDEDTPYELAELDTRSQAFVSLTIETDDGDGETVSDASFEVQTRPSRDAPWFGGWQEYDDIGSVRETFQTGSRFVRVVLTSESATEDAVADVAIEASG